MHTGCAAVAREAGPRKKAWCGDVVEVVRVDQRRRTVPWIALGVVYVLWGSTYLANRFIIVSMPPLLASGFRFMTGGLLLGILVLLFAGPRVFAMTRAQLGTAALSGLLLPAWGNGLVILAQSQVSSGLTALLIASVPLYIAVLRALTGDRPRRATVLGVLVGAAGLALLVLVGPSGGSGGVSGSAWWGPPLVLLAGAGWATGTFAAARMAVPANPFALATVQQLIGGAVLVATGTIVGERLHPATVAPVSWWAWLYMSLFVSLGAFSAYAYALATLPVSTVATYAYVNPVIAVVLGVVVAGERFSAVQLVGGAIVLVAVVMVIAAERPAPAAGRVREAPAVTVVARPRRRPPVRRSADVLDRASVAGPPCAGIVARDRVAGNCRWWMAASPSWTRRSTCSAPPPPAAPRSRRRGSPTRARPAW